MIRFIILLALLGNVPRGAGWTQADCDECRQTFWVTKCKNNANLAAENWRSCLANTYQVPSTVKSCYTQELDSAKCSSTEYHEPAGNVPRAAGWTQADCDECRQTFWVAGDKTKCADGLNLAAKNWRSCLADNHHVPPTVKSCYTQELDSATTLNCDYTEVTSPAEEQTWPAESTWPAKAVDLCKDNECKNGATCYPDTDGLSVYCVCPEGYTGVKCETVDLCKDNECKNGATCHPNAEDGSVYCECHEGYTGIKCEKVDLCKDNECKNGATCHSNAEDGSVYCECHEGYTGIKCEKDECANNPCQNEGTCIPVKGGYSCDCPGGTTGTNCGECVGNPCENGGTCLFKENVFYCACPNGITGAYCDECDGNPCQNGGTCLLDKGEIYCACPNGITGAYCETKKTKKTKKTKTCRDCKEKHCKQKCNGKGQKSQKKCIACKKKNCSKLCKGTR